MEDPVNLTNLHGMTDGDAEMEKELFVEFHSSFEAGIAALQVSIRDNEAETWRQQAHALKGVALNLGAEKLGDLCMKAQDENHMTPESKGHIIQDIRQEYELVKAFLAK